MADALDPQTFAAYERHAAGYAEEWEAQPPPSDLHELVRRYFMPGPTADIGCGSGRETAWLNEHGFFAVGYDASPALLAEAQRRHPGVRFQASALPALAELGSETFANVLCETVIMHLPAGVIEASVARLAELLAPGGMLYLSWRVTEDGDLRDDRGRLYAAFDADLVRRPLAALETLHDEASLSVSSGRTVHRLIARRP
jgi:SAM-dependent methyltransferase